MSVKWWRETESIAITLLNVGSLIDGLSTVFVLGFAIMVKPISYLDNALQNYLDNDNYLDK